jgi:[protein-PII] uridylyltransferase
MPRSPNRVEIDNEVSDEYTVIDIYARQVGLLYQITKALKELGLSSGFQVIHQGRPGRRHLYVQDIFGQKITHAEKLDEIRSACSSVEGK